MGGHWALTGLFPFSQSAAGFGWVWRFSSQVPPSEIVPQLQMSEKQSGATEIATFSESNED